VNKFQVLKFGQISFQNLKTEVEFDKEMKVFVGGIGRE
jgi:hypothetical protein